MTVDEVEEIVRLINQRDVWDYVIAVAPFLASIISIAISIATAKRQNKIALFEKRYKAADTLLFLLEVAGYVIVGKNNRKEILKVCANNYMAVKQSGEYIIDDANVLSFFTTLIFEAGKVCYLYRLVDSKNIQNFLTAFMDAVSEICEDRNFQVSILLEKVDSLENSKTKKIIDKELQIR